MSQSASTASTASGPSDPIASHSPSRPQPSAWIVRCLARLPRGARVLDFAAGSGRHLRLARSLGLSALGVDRNTDALDADGYADGLDADRTGDTFGTRGDAGALAATAREPGSVDTLVLDLESGPWSLPPGAFDAVIVANYLFRARFALLCGLLAPGGLLIYETFGLGNEAYGRPSNPSFLLREGELLERASAAGLIVLAYESGYTDRPKPAIVQRICASRPPIDGKRLALG